MQPNSEQRRPLVTHTDPAALSPPSRQGTEREVLARGSQHSTAELGRTAGPTLAPRALAAGLQVS